MFSSYIISIHFVGHCNWEEQEQPNFNACFDNLQACKELWGKLYADNKYRPTEIIKWLVNDEHGIGEIKKSAEYKIFKEHSIYVSQWLFLF